VAARIRGRGLSFNAVRYVAMSLRARGMAGARAGAEWPSGEVAVSGVIRFLDDWVPGRWEVAGAAGRGVLVVKTGVDLRVYGSGHFIRSFVSVHLGFSVVQQDGR
jgi:hypothetical protein